VYCSKCGALMANGAAFCLACGQAFSVTAVTAVAAAPGMQYGGFWLRFAAYLIDSVVIVLGATLISIPLIFLTGLGALLSQIHIGEELNDAGVFFFIGLFLLFGVVSLALTWLYHALMESSEWQATVGKRAVGIIVTDAEGRRVSFARASGRHFAKIVSNLIPLEIGYIMAGFTQKKQALHDMLADCLILRRSY
jgi:uncharacterized RDD family membrane protein YckC